mmetsp:Transcript_80390/g.211136  ORF Transcript_80390/g.211136 Transcript_80390/m.211136 type:complete len:171 (-) Transcript_80390:198-710(-)
MRVLTASSALLACGLVAAQAYVMPSRPATSALAPEASARGAALSGPAGVADGPEGAAVWRPLIAGLALGLLAAVAGGRPAAAAMTDAEKNGVKVFAENCATCHYSGKNTLVSDRTLDKAVLQKYGMFDLEKIKYQVINGKNAMPAQDERLTREDITDVANYVLTQAAKGW